MWVKSTDITLSLGETKIIICFNFISSGFRCNKYIVESKCVRLSKVFGFDDGYHKQLQQLEVLQLLSGPVQLLKKKPVSPFQSVLITVALCSSQLLRGQCTFMAQFKDNVRYFVNLQRLVGCALTSKVL